MNPICISCKKPCILGVNVYSEAGVREVIISQTCELCFDEMFEEMEDEDHGYGDGDFM